MPPVHCQRDIIAHCVGVCSTSGRIATDKTHTRLSLVSYLDPSPDWFVGVYSFALCQQGAWISHARIPLFAFDMGTHEGDTFEWSTLATEPQGNVSRFLDRRHSIFVDPTLCGPPKRPVQQQHVLADPKGSSK